VAAYYGAFSRRELNPIKLEYHPHRSGDRLQPLAVSRGGRWWRSLTHKEKMKWIKIQKLKKK